tara:strand:- start:797 stop:2071 length:1275 start_codon:yes stop_codon:yes gene_type:complete
VSDPLRAVFRKPFTQQVAAFRARLGDLVPTSRWDDLERSAHDRAFMVAGATKADLLADLAGAVDKAIAQGTGIDAFRDDFRAIVEKHGWHGWTGEGTAKGEAWRTKVIFRTNMAVSRAAGRLAQLKDGAFPFFVYQHSGAEHPRLQHLAWDGLVLEADHAFWTQHYPPNGWGCGCIVRGARSRKAAKRVGGLPDKDLPDGWDDTDPSTGAPVGIGKGWDYAPGASSEAMVLGMAEKLPRWQYDIGKAFMTSLPRQTGDDLSGGYRALPSLGDDLRRYAERAIRERNGAPITGKVLVEELKTLGLIRSDQALKLKSLGMPDTRGFDYVVDAPAVKHIFKSHGNADFETARGQRQVTSADFGLLGRIINTGDVEFLGIDAGQGPLVRYRAQIGDEVYSAVFAAKSGRRRLKLVTMFVKGVTGKSPP